MNNKITIMGEKIKANVYKWLPIILTTLFWYFGIIKENEKSRVDIIYLQKSCDIINIKLEKLEEKKVDKETFNLILVSINRIEDKLDKLK